MAALENGDNRAVVTRHPAGLLISTLVVVCAAACGSSSPASPSAVSSAPIPTPTPFPVPPGILWSGTTVGASPSVLASVWKANDNLAVLILWRGTPEWWATEAKGSNSYGESAGGGPLISDTLRFGSFTVAVTFDTTLKIASVQGGAPTVLAAGTNVLFIDDIDSASGPVLAGAVALNPGGSTPVGSLLQSFAPLYTLSPAIVAFLRCDLTAPPDPLFGPLPTFACAELGH